jgi:hypothetical protein
MAQGYAYPVGASSTGLAAAATIALTSASTNTTVWTASQKTMVNSVLITNSSGGILPVYLYVNRGGSDLQISYQRVWKQDYAVLPLVSGDQRTGNPEGQLAGVLTELILNSGDILKAMCPVANAITITAYLSQGIK